MTRQDGHVEYSVQCMAFSGQYGQVILLHRTPNVQLALYKRGFRRVDFFQGGCVTIYMREKA